MILRAFVKQTLYAKAILISLGERVSNDISNKGGSYFAFGNRREKNLDYSISETLDAGGFVSISV